MCSFKNSNNNLCSWNKFSCHFENCIQHSSGVSISTNDSSQLVLCLNVTFGNLHNFLFNVRLRQNNELSSLSLF